MRMVESMVSGIEGTAEVLYPENDFGAPDWRSTDMASRTLRYLEDLPPHRTPAGGRAVRGRRRDAAALAG
jgi:hypothetical protein